MLLTNNNKKLKKSSIKNNAKIFEFNLPAYKTVKGKTVCPFAKDCIKFCYAKKGSYTWKNTVKKYDDNYHLSKKDIFIDTVNNEIKRKRKITHVRVHSSGDYYSPKYLNKWVKIARQNPNQIYYSYTKSVAMAKALKNKPKNLKFIFSLGGKQDNLINLKTDRHAKIFNNEAELLAEGYINASDDDLNALTPNKKVGLIYH
tara:strand:+ start:1165 stop:1767 length:603 start_codon:yes stop_codon:yes gene_type:complete